MQDFGSEFLPHLDEGALWVRGTLAPSTGPDEGIRVSNQARLVLCSFPDVLEDKANQIAGLLRQVPGIEDLGVFHVLGQPNLNVTVNRAAVARYQINVADVQDAIQTAVGGNALTQVLQGEARYDLVLRYLPQYRSRPYTVSPLREVRFGGVLVTRSKFSRA